MAKKKTEDTALPRKKQDPASGPDKYGRYSGPDERLTTPVRSQDERTSSRGAGPGAAIGGVLGGGIGAVIGGAIGGSSLGGKIFGRKDHTTPEEYAVIHSNEFAKKMGGYSGIDWAKTYTDLHSGGKAAGHLGNIRHEDKYKYLEDRFGEYKRMTANFDDMSEEERRAGFIEWASMGVKDRKRIYGEWTKQDNLNKDFQQGEEYKNRLLGEDFKLDRLMEDPEMQDVKNRLEKNTRLSSEEKLARQETAYNALASSEQTQSRSMLKQLSAAGVRGGAAAGAIGQLAQQQAIGRREIAQNLYLEEQGFERAALDKYAQFQTQTKQFDIGQAEKEANMILQTQLAGISASQNERDALRQLQNQNK